ncbi:transcriptional regulator [Sphaerisporangium krabiense]|uniref:DNA-binding transcriptional ArsR family regulator n=1 Tax=Sphaerisporangium krabiense TaxID=763782 RepID=A0A7W8ZB91_9ACTN|nr:helix-turn-helix transcriptional regulator [Sphaerisporangium krabiense]MBB5630824.1 DNA-binding transcriptional ArsR family regulator [Sphaerisporangium krabiense]GII65493.1 transcriptional regulator [Sphaerisporangium krabiense]
MAEHQAGHQAGHQAEADIASVAALIAEPSRAAVLTALLDGRALAAGELARLAGVSPATASAHLARLLDGGLLSVAGQGRHRYYRLAGPEVAEILEVLARVSPRLPVRSLRQSRRARLLGEARTCYDHLAGRAGVGLLAAMLAAGHLTGADAFEVTPAGEEALAGLGADLTAARRSRRRFAAACLDWTERRPHLAGALGAEITRALLERDWYRREPAGRALRLTELGEKGLAAMFPCKGLTSHTPVT